MKLKLTDEYFKEKANYYCDLIQNGSKGKIFFTEGHRVLIYTLLKEVSRDTRHACSELKVGRNPFLSESLSAAFDMGQKFHAIECLNI